MSQRSEGGEGSTLIGTLSQIFSIFYFDGSPNLIVLTFNQLDHFNSLQQILNELQSVSVPVPVRSEYGPVQPQLVVFDVVCVF